MDICSYINHNLLLCCRHVGHWLQAENVDFKCLLPFVVTRSSVEEGTDVCALCLENISFKSRDFHTVNHFR